MSHHSTIRSLPFDVRAELDRRIAADDYTTIDGLTDWLRQGGNPRSRSAVHRYVQSARRRMGPGIDRKNLPEVLAMIEALVARARALTGAKG